MHIEKNVCENIINTLLCLDGKSKDNLNSRLDLQPLNIRSGLHPIELEAEDKFYLPPAPYEMNVAQQKLICGVFKGARFPYGLAVDICGNVHVKERKIIRLKIHDNHILMQHLLPLVVRRLLPEKVSATLIRVSNFFKQIYSHVISVSDMEKLEAEIAETLSILETIFPPSFFHIMVHLMVHLPAQAKIAGPVHFRNMFPIERYLCQCKGFVHTRSHPEGSIAKSYLFDETLTFCSRYLKGETQFTRQIRNDQGLGMETSSTTLPFFSNLGRGLVGKHSVLLDNKTGLQAHRYVLFNYDHIEPYLNKHKEYLSSNGLKNNRQFSHVQHESFHEWFKKHVEEMGDKVPEKLVYSPGRDKKIVEVHTSKKTGAPTPLAVPLIKKLQTEAALHPELEENSIEEGDLYAHVFGEKEPRGRVHILGMGPTIETVGVPGSKAKVPTKLAMQMQLHRRAEQAISTLKEQMQAMERCVDDTQAMFSQGSHSVEMPTPSPPHSVSRPVFSGIVPDDDDEEEEHEGHHDAVQEHDGLFIQKGIPSSHNAESTHLPHRSHVATPCVRQAFQASHNQEDPVGRDILYHLVRSDPVAKAVVISTNQETIVGGEVLGLQY